MRKFKLLTGFVWALLLSTNTKAQEIKSKGQPEIKRCATMENLEAYYQENPAAKAEAARNANRAGGVGGENYRLNAIVTIPVVIHVVLPNPNVVTPGDVNYFINRLNLDYSGLNPDSANASGFYSRRGHSQIRFCLARRTPTGAITTGIDKKFSATASTGGTNDPIKRSAQGGADSWDNTSYLNIWVGNGVGGILGYATFPGTASAANDGVFINYQCFAANSCYTYAEYNMGRTATHEVGHYLGLYHIWGDDGTACTGDDFGQLTGSCLLPSGLFNTSIQANTASDVGDTPNQAGETYGCSPGVLTDACATTAPGKMFQNYMDYSDDACLTLFTNKQAARMEWVIDNCRAGLKTSLGCSAPGSFPAVDAGLESIVSPGGSDFNSTTCTITSYPTPSCPGSFVPRVSVANFGVNTITSITATVTVGTVTSAPIVFPVTILANGTATLTFPASTLVAGTNNITFTITAVNGAADTYTANNTISTSVSVTSGAFPFAQDFVTTTFPPANMSIFNPNGNITWTRRANGNVTAGSAFINNYDNNLPNQIDDIRTQPLVPPTGATGTDSLIISFDLAHRPFSATTTVNADTLKVLVSTDCGATFTQVYSRWNRSTPSLSTGAALATSYLNPAAADWRRENISLPGSYFTGGNIVVAFRNINRYGNNIFLDNINVEAKIVTRRDLSVIASNLAAITCNSVSPVITVRNPGRDTITSYKLGYSVDNGAVTSITRSNLGFVPGTTRNDTLTNVTLPAGNHTIKFFTFDPVSVTGTGDQNVANDTLTRAIRVFGTQAAPLVESFDATTFPPANWVLNNPDNQSTWVRTTSASRSGVASAYINNFNYANTGARDELYSPQVTYTGADSVFLSFDVAAATYSYPGSTAIPLDTLEVLVTNNCGVTYTSIYKKWGAQLQTINDPNTTNATEFVPRLASQWRNEKIDLSFYASRSPIEVVFRNTNNYENNIYLDNVNLSTKTLPTRLKEQGYLIYPTLFNTSFTIQHYLSPTELRGIAVYNSIGQRVVAQTYSVGGASSTMQIDMSRFASGVYTVVLHYANRTISQKIIKAH